MAFSNSLSRERASLTKQARIYSDREQARIYVSETEQGGIYSEGKAYKYKYKYKVGSTLEESPRGWWMVVFAAEMRR